ncbi:MULTISPECIES: hypothetical protein [Levilactobacillus]|uniref:hypothetical protein n=1 Tax=Levilactobacillus TaxID=2767886 RepID=UPI003756ACA1
MLIGRSLGMSVNFQRLANENCRHLFSRRFFSFSCGPSPSYFGIDFVVKGYANHRWFKVCTAWLAALSASEANWRFNGLSGDLTNSLFSLIGQIKKL